MKRHYFITDKISDIEQIERDLLAAQIPENQIHALSQEESKLNTHNLHPVADFMKTDVVNKGLQGLIIGCVAAITVLLIAATMGWHSQIGWVPFVFLAIVLLGFCTWEGGFLGFQQQNRVFRRFTSDLDNHKHVLFVDVSDDQEESLQQILNAHPRVRPAGSGTAVPAWIAACQRSLHKFFRWAP